jgi:hypothetical protein
MMIFVIASKPSGIPSALLKIGRWHVMTQEQTTPSDWDINPHGLCHGRDRFKSSAIKMGRHVSGVEATNHSPLTPKNSVPTCHQLTGLQTPCLEYFWEVIAGMLVMPHSCCLYLFIRTYVIVPPRGLHWDSRRQTRDFTLCCPEYVQVSLCFLLVSQVEIRLLLIYPVWTYFPIWDIQSWKVLSIVRCIQSWIYHLIWSTYSCDTLWYSIPSTVPPLILVFFPQSTSLAGSSQRVVYDCYHVTVTGCKWGIDWCRGMKLNETTYLCPPFNMCFPWSLIFCRWDSPITRNSGNRLQSWHLP